MKTWILVAALAASGALAQEDAGAIPPDPAASEVPVPIAVDTAKAQRDGAAAAEAESLPRYRNREPMRASGTPKEQTDGTAKPISPDKTTRGGGDW